MHEIPFMKNTEPAINQKAMPFLTGSKYYKSEDPPARRHYFLFSPLKVHEQRTSLSTAIISHIPGHFKYKRNEAFIIC